MARRRIKILLYVLATLGALFAVVVVVMRVKSHGSQPAAVVHNQVVHVRNFFVDLYGARQGDKVFLFDAGIDVEGGALDALLKGLKADRDAVTDVFLTHGHFDHIAASPLCKKARIHLGIRDVDMAAQKQPYQPAIAGYTSKIFSVPPVMATDAFIDRAELDVGDGQKLLAIPLPGHTPGSFMLLYDKVLFSGDSILMSDGQLTFADPKATVDVEANKRGIAGLKTALAGATVDFVCTGHMGCTAPGQAQKLLDDLIERASK
jgi:hydroxyacylglutathione hydrolase